MPGPVPGCRVHSNRAGGVRHAAGGLLRSGACVIAAAHVSSAPSAHPRSICSVYQSATQVRCQPSAHEAASSPPRAARACSCPPAAAYDSIRACVRTASGSAMVPCQDARSSRPGPMNARAKSSRCQVRRPMCSDVGWYSEWQSPNGGSSAPEARCGAAAASAWARLAASGSSRRASRSAIRCGMAASAAVSTLASHVPPSASAACRRTAARAPSSSVASLAGLAQVIEKHQQGAWGSPGGADTGDGDAVPCRQAERQVLAVERGIGVLEHHGRATGEPQSLDTGVRPDPQRFPGGVSGQAGISQEQRQEPEGVRGAQVAILPSRRGGRRRRLSATAAGTAPGRRGTGRWMHRRARTRRRTGWARTGSRAPAGPRGRRVP